MLKNVKETVEHALVVGLALIALITIVALTVFPVMPAFQ
jgi:hypothetical protein